jgi:uncharacterized protein
LPFHHRVLKMKDTTLKKISYLGGLLILAGTLVSSNIPFLLYAKKLIKKEGYSESYRAFSQNGDISFLPLSLGERFFYTFFPFIILLGTLFFIWKFLHRKKLISLLTGSEKFRFILFRKGFFFWIILSFSADLVQFILHRDRYQFSFEPTSWFALLFLGILFILPQIMLEEAFFRSYIIKGGTLFIKHPLVPLILSSLIFGLLHMANPEVSRYGMGIMLPQYIGMGFFLSYLCWKTEGLELSLGVHMANNCWGLIIVNSGGTAFETPSPVTMTNWDPLFSLITLITAIGIFILYFQIKILPSQKSNHEYYFDN